MTRDDAVRFLSPKWQVSSETRARGALVLTLDSGHVVEIYDNGTFHVSGKGWRDINRHLQECQFPHDDAVRTGQIRNSLAKLPIPQKNYFSEGLNCIQFAQAPRAAIVLGWSGFMDVLHDRLLRDLTGLNQALAARFPKLHSKGQLRGIDDIRSLEDWQALALGLEMNLYKKHAHTQLDAMRDLRNNCAHVEEFPVTVDMALGFYAALVQYLDFVLDST